MPFQTLASKIVRKRFGNRWIAVITKILTAGTTVAADKSVAPLACVEAIVRGSVPAILTKSSPWHGGFLAVVV